MTNRRDFRNVCAAHSSLTSRCYQKQMTGLTKLCKGLGIWTCSLWQKLKFQTLGSCITVFCSLSALLLVLNSYGWCNNFKLKKKKNRQTKNGALSKGHRMIGGKGKLFGRCTHTCAHVCTPQTYSFDWSFVSLIPLTVLEDGFAVALNSSLKKKKCDWRELFGTRLIGLPKSRRTDHHKSEAGASCYTASLNFLSVAGQSWGHSPCWREDIQADFTQLNSGLVQGAQKMCSCLHSCPVWHKM